MYYLTLDAELADRYLPSICDIGIVAWQDGVVVSEYHSYINPDCDIEEFFHDRHGLTEEFLSKAPYIQNVWIQIYDMLEGNLVFMYDANRVIKTFTEMCIVNQLNMPDITYASAMSLSRRTWKGLDDYRIINVTEWMGITHKHNSAIEDARSIGTIINEAVSDTGAEDIDDLFHITGFSGGKIKKGKKLPYRAIKDKRLGIYRRRTA